MSMPRTLYYDTSFTPIKIKYYTKFVEVFGPPISQNVAQFWVKNLLVRILGGPWPPSLCDSGRRSVLVMGTSWHPPRLVLQCKVNTNIAEHVDWTRLHSHIWGNTYWGSTLMQIIHIFRHELLTEETKRYVLTENKTFAHGWMQGCLLELRYE